MSDLISRKAVMNFIDSRIAERKPDGNSIWLRNDEAIDIQAGIEDLPTAYDVDGVVIEISDYFQSYIRNCNLTEEDTLTMLYMEEHITKLVKGAVKDE